MPTPPVWSVKMFARTNFICNGIMGTPPHQQSEVLMMVMSH